MTQPPHRVSPFGPSTLSSSTPEAAATTIPQPEQRDSSAKMNDSALAAYAIADADAPYFWWNQETAGLSEINDVAHDFAFANDKTTHGGNWEMSRSDLGSEHFALSSEMMTTKTMPYPFDPTEQTKFQQSYADIGAEAAWAANELLHHYAEVKTGHSHTTPPRPNVPAIFQALDQSATFIPSTTEAPSPTWLSPRHIPSTPSNAKSPNTSTQVEKSPHIDSPSSVGLLDPTLFAVNPNLAMPELKMQERTFENEYGEGEPSLVRLKFTTATLQQRALLSAKPQTPWTNANAEVGSDVAFTASIPEEPLLSEEEVAELERLKSAITVKEKEWKAVNQQQNAALSDRLEGELHDLELKAMAVSKAAYQEWRDSMWYK